MNVHKWFIKTFDRVVVFSTYILVSILIGILVGFFAGERTTHKKFEDFFSEFKNFRENSERYKYINPLIGNLSPDATKIGFLNDLKKEVDNYLEKEKKKGSLSDVSFYFRDIDTGFWFGINESATFFPASLFKLPIAIIVYKKSERESSFLDKYVVYTESIASINSVSLANAETKLKIGESYRIKDLVDLMIVESDNGAKDLLLSNLDLKEIDEFLTLTNPFEERVTLDNYNLSARGYSRFLRMLYNSSYLNEENSEYLLSLLSKSTFKEGLVSGIPSRIEVAHKYGVYEKEEEINGKKENLTQLHDCGIIYHDEKPYILCFMTKGKDLKDLFRVISRVSEIVYNYQDNKK